MRGGGGGGGGGGGREGEAKNTKNPRAPSFPFSQAPRANLSPHSISHVEKNQKSAGHWGGER